MEMGIRWALDRADKITFLGPVIATAAIGLIGPVAVARVDRVRGKDVSYLGLWGLIISLIGWCFCLMVNIKDKVPSILDGVISPSWFQFLVSIVLYVLGIWLTVLKEAD